MFLAAGVSWLTFWDWLWLAVLFVMLAGLFWVSK
jgi:hypothetical protein